MIETSEARSPAEYGDENSGCTLLGRWGIYEIAGVSSGGRVSQWVAAHEELTLLARRRSELDGLEGPALLRALRAGVHRHLGFGSFAEYVERLFGYSRRTLDDNVAERDLETSRMLG